jgi:hypothetical protein
MLGNVWLLDVWQLVISLSDASEDVCADDEGPSV